MSKVEETYNGIQSGLNDGLFPTGEIRERFLNQIESYVDARLSEYKQEIIEASEQATVGEHEQVKEKCVCDEPEELRDVQYIHMCTNCNRDI
tara:strand:- start:8939 stop:9214 length:276 start_codon:yes stop_codon:yes gene_type:complete